MFLKLGNKSLQLNNEWVVSSQYPTHHYHDEKTQRWKRMLLMLSLSLFYMYQVPTIPESKTKTKVDKSFLLKISSSRVWFRNKWQSNHDVRIITRQNCIYCHMQYFGLRTLSLNSKRSWKYKTFGLGLSNDASAIFFSGPTLLRTHFVM